MTSRGRVLECSHQLRIAIKQDLVLLVQSGWRLQEEELAQLKPLAAARVRNVLDQVSAELKTRGKHSSPGFPRGGSSVFVGDDSLKGKIAADATDARREDDGRAKLATREGRKSKTPAEVTSTRKRQKKESLGSDAAVETTPKKSPRTVIGRLEATNKSGKRRATSLDLSVLREKDATPKRRRRSPASTPRRKKREKKAQRHP